jgi:hypothetical protein
LTVTHWNSHRESDAAYRILYALRTGQPVGFNDIEMQSGLSSATVSKFLKANTGSLVQKTSEGTYAILPQGRKEIESLAAILRMGKYAKREGDRGYWTSESKVVNPHLVFTVSVGTKVPPGIASVVKVTPRIERLAKDLLEEMQVEWKGRTTGGTVVLEADWMDQEDGLG